MDAIDEYLSQILGASDEVLLHRLSTEFLQQEFVLYDRQWPETTSPLILPLGFKGAVATLESQFSTNAKPDLETARNFCVAIAAAKCGFGQCYYGAADYSIHPFHCESPSTEKICSAQSILNVLSVRDFRSEFVSDLSAYELPSHGYRPSTFNDEIHNDFKEQYMFCNDDAPNDGEPGVLRRYALNNQLWHVLLHEWVGPTSRDKGPLVTMFTLAIAPDQRHLVGMVTHQVCHNLCD